ncbi:MAG: hypothetical protein M3154_06940, partial [Candidatus Eremiobacteraeota bacterium]|nr:hypothetical protein [Candidatus Eremiobacteraeota bacterium]
MRPLVLAAVPFLAGLVLAAGAPAASAGNPPPSTSVLVVADLGETAQRTMPGALWRRLVADYLGGHPVSVEDGTALPDEARCRSAHAAFAVFA